MLFWGGVRLYFVVIFFLKLLWIYGFYENGVELIDLLFIELMELVDWGVVVDVVGLIYILVEGDIDGGLFWSDFLLFLFFSKVLLDFGFCLFFVFVDLDCGWFFVVFL